MNEQDYQFLIDLHETQNITKMAQRQFLTQPAMTKRIKRIEEELGCELMLRTKRGVTFTSVGESVIRYCREMQHMNQQMRDSINLYQGVVGGSLSIGSSLNYCRYRLPSALRLYQEQYPLVDVSINTGHSKALYTSLMEGKISVAIIRGNYNWDDGCQVLSTEPVCFVCNEENKDKPLSDYPYIAHHTDLDEERRMEQWAGENGINIRDTRLWIDDITSCREMAAAGLGWSILPSICLDGFPGKVVPLKMKDGTKLTRNTYVLYRSSHYELQQVKLFIEALLENESKFGTLE